MEPNETQSGGDRGTDKSVDPVSDTVNSIAQLHSHSEQNVPYRQMIIEKLTRTLGRPGTVWVMLSFLLLWLILSIYHKLFHIPAFDNPPQFSTLQLIIGTVALLTATMILITENRQSQREERRARLDLQISILTEQKIAKLIALVEELREDLPNVRNRHDPEADAMKQSADPHAISEALEQALEEASEQMH